MAPAVWDAYADLVGINAAKGNRAKVCMIDTGVKATHSDLDSARLSGSTLGGLAWDEDDVGHGTHVTGIVGGASHNNEGFSGVAPEAELYIIRVFDNNGIFSSDLVTAMQECARQGAKVITMSLGGAGGSNSERITIDQLFHCGVVLVAASGNSGDSDNPVEYPAGYGNVISVGAVDANKRIASFSSFNDQVSLVAPGVGITSLGTASNDAYTLLSGTSMACPHVAGVAALLFSIFENASSRPVSDALFNSAQGLGHCGKNAKFGHGHVDAKAAADLLQSGILPQANCEEAAVTIKPDQYGSETTWQITNPQGVSIAGGGPNQDGNQDHKVTQVNLPQLLSGECYTFTIFDSSGDGLCCGYGEGDYKVTLKGTKVSSSPRPNAFSATEESRQFGCGTGAGNMCGNGIVEGGEECYDGNINHDDECTNQCVINGRTAACGNSILEESEECDDGNNINNDGCSNQCTITTSAAVCGNGILEGSEECDDGNDIDGDGCGTDCRTEVPVGECDYGLEKVLLSLETDRWSTEENEMCLFNVLDEGTRSAWIWDYPYGSMPSNGSIELAACLDPGSCYYFEFYDDYRDGLSLEDSNGLIMAKEDGRLLFDIAPDVRGPYSFGRVWIQYLGACSLD